MAENLPNTDPHNKDARSSLATMIMRLFEHWGLSSREQLDLLGLESSSRASLARYRKGLPLADHRDLLDRVGHLLGIHKSLRIIFPENPELAYAWMRRKNRDFDQLSPVEVIQAHGFTGLLMVRTYLDQVRGQ